MFVVRQVQSATFRRRHGRGGPAKGVKQGSPELALHEQREQLRLKVSRRCRVLLTKVADVAREIADLHPKTHVAGRLEVAGGQGFALAEKLRRFPSLPQRESVRIKKCREGGFHSRADCMASREPVQTTSDLSDVSEAVHTRTHAQTHAHTSAFTNRLK